MLCSSACYTHMYVFSNQMIELRLMRLRSKKIVAIIECFEDCNQIIQRNSGRVRKLAFFDSTKLEFLSGYAAKGSTKEIIVNGVRSTGTPAR